MIPSAGWAFEAIESPSSSKAGHSFSLSLSLSFLFNFGPAFPRGAFCFPA